MYPSLRFGWHAFDIPESAIAHLHIVAPTVHGALNTVARRVLHGIVFSPFRRRALWVARFDIVLNGPAAGQVEERVG